MRWQINEKHIFFGQFGNCRRCAALLLCERVTNRLRLCKLEEWKEKIWMKTSSETKLVRRTTGRDEKKKKKSIEIFKFRRVKASSGGPHTSTPPLSNVGIWETFSINLINYVFGRDSQINGKKKSVENGMQIIICSRFPAIYTYSRHRFGSMYRNDWNSKWYNYKRKSSDLIRRKKTQFEKLKSARRRLNSRMELLVRSNLIYCCFVVDDVAVIRKWASLNENHREWHGDSLYYIVNGASARFKRKLLVKSCSFRISTRPNRPNAVCALCVCVRQTTHGLQTKKEKQKEVSSGWIAFAERSLCSRTMVLGISIGRNGCARFGLPCAVNVLDRIDGTPHL